MNATGLICGILITPLLLAFAPQGFAQLNPPEADGKPRVGRGTSPIAGVPAEAQRELNDLFTKASHSQATGNLADAAEALQTAIAILRKHLGNEHPDVARSLVRLGSVLLKSKKPEQAVPILERALNIYKRAMPEEVRYGAALSYVGDLYYSAGDYARAERAYRESVAIMNTAFSEEHAQYAMVVDKLALACRDKGSFAEAENLFQKALVIRRKTLGEAHPQYAASLNNLASVFDLTGDHDRAEPLYKQALSTLKKAVGEKHPDYAIALNNLASLYQDKGDFAKAEPLCKQAIAIYRSSVGDRNADFAVAVATLGSLYRDMGDYARAEPSMKLSLSIFETSLGKDHPYFAIGLNNLAAIYKDKGDFTAAEPLLEQALIIRKKLLGVDHPEYAASLNNLAELYASMGEYSRAVPLYQEATAVTKSALGEGHSQYATSLHNLGALYLRMHHYARAESLYEQALTVLKKAVGEEHPHFATALAHMAELHYWKDDYGRAEPYAQHALRIRHRLLQRSAIIQSERQQLAMLGILRSALDLYLSIAAGRNNHEQFACESAIAWKGAVFSRRRAVGALAAAPELKPTFEHLKQVTAELAQLTVTSFDSKMAALPQSRIAELSERVDQLGQELSHKSDTYRRAIQPPTLNALKAALPENALLVDFVRYLYLGKSADLDPKSHYMAFLVRRGQPVKILNLTRADEIEKLIDSWREGHGSGAAAEKAGQELRRLLWEPLVPYVKGCDLVLISPDASLASLPFGALPGRAEGSYLVEEMRLAVVPVPQLLPELLEDEQGRQPPKSSLLAVGDIDYDAKPGEAILAGAKRTRSVVRNAQEERAFAPLDSTRAETLAIRTTFTSAFNTAQAIELSGKKATEEQFRILAPRHRFLHIATHGYFAPPNVRSALGPEKRLAGQLLQQGNRSLFDVHGLHPGLLSGLALAGANREPQPNSYDGILTAEEVATLNLSNVDLAVLSACDTGLGKVAGGEGLLGLQRAFQVAGARSCIASLWKVDDAATQALMTEFYRNLWEKKLSKVESLRQAQLTMLRHYDPKISKLRGVGGTRATDGPNATTANRLPPFYWAAFTLSGDWR